MFRSLVCCALLLTAANATRADAPSPAPSPVAATIATRPGLLPLETFARLPFVEQETLSPDGTHWAGLFAVNGAQMVLILSIADGKEPVMPVVVHGQTEVLSISWANNRNVLLGLRTLQGVEFSDWYVTRTVAVDRLTGALTRLLWHVAGQNASEILWRPSDESNQVLIAAQNSIYADNVELWPAVHRVDVTNGKDHIEQISRTGITEWAIDARGMVRAGSGYRDDTRTAEVIYRPASGSRTFETVARRDLRNADAPPEPFLFMGESDRALVIHDDDRGMASIYEQDIRTQKDLRAVFVPEHGEVTGTIVSRDGSTFLGAYTSDNHVHWFDPALAEVQTKLQASVPGLGVQITSVSVDRKKMLVRTGAADAPGAVMYYDVDDGVLHRLAFVNERLGSQHLAPVRTIRYEARDGLQIEGYLTLPVGRPAKNLPLIVMPHGGPWSRDTLRYDYWQQFLANRGYAVLQPNFRGSTGYGTAFMRRGEGQLGLAMQDDVSDAVHWAVTEGIADPARVCIVGASYGGYAAMWGIAKDPDLYRCAISIAGVSALKRDVAEFSGSMNRRLYTSDWKRMAPDFDAVSPLNAVEKIKTPLLLIHGEKDVTVSSVQSSKMYDRMRKASKTVELVLLPLADHYYSREADRVTLLRSIEAFLSKYNPADPG